MAEPLNFSRLLDLSDDQPIKKAIENIEKLNAGLDVLVSNARDVSQNYTKALEAINKSTLELEKSISSLDATSKKDQEVLAKSASDVESLVVKNNEYSKALKNTEDTIISLTKSQKDLSTAQSKLSKANKTEAGSLNDLKKKLDDAVKSYKNLGASASESVRKDHLDNVTRLSNEYNKVNGALTTAKKTVDFAAGSYRELNAQVVAGKKRLKEMEGGLEGNSREFKELQKSVSDGSKKLKEFDAAVGDNQRKVGNYRDALRGFTGQILGAAGFIVGIQGAINVVRQFITVNRDFEKSLSELSAITGATGDDLQFYNEQAKEIGATTTLSASQAVEAFKLIGSARPELLKIKEDLADVTKEAIVLAEASGLELPAAASALVGALNQLELPSSDAARVINALAAGAKEGASEIPESSEALKKFGAVAKTANVSIEESTALIQTLADRQISGAEAGTSLRNVLLRLSAVETLPKDAIASLTKYGVNLDKVSDTTLPLNERLREFGKISGDLNAIVEVFGKENAVAGQIILQNTDRFESLTTAVTGTSVAYDQAAVSVDNLDGDLKSLSSVTEALFLDLGASSQSFFRSFIQGLTIVVQALRDLPAFVIANQQAFLALGIAIIGLKAPLIISQALLIKDAAVKQYNVIATKAATLATKQFYLTLAANPIGLVIAAIAALVAALFVYDKNSARANKITEQTNELNEDLEKALQDVKAAREASNITIDEFLKLSPKEQKALQDEIKLRKEEALAILDSILAKQEALKQTAKETTGTQKVVNGLLALAQGYGVAGSAASSFYINEAIDSAKNQKEVEDQFKDRIENLKNEINGFDEFIKDSNKAQLDEQEELIEKEKDNSFKLQKFRIEQAAKVQKDILDAEKNGLEERQAAARKFTDLQKQLAVLERNERLTSEKLTNSERILINEQYYARIREIERGQVKDLEAIRLESLESANALNEAILRGAIKANEEILNNERSSLQQRTEALAGIVEAKQEILDNELEIELSKESLSTSERLQIQEEYNQASEGLAKELADGLEKVYFEEVKNDFESLTNTAETETDKQLKALYDAFAAGDIKSIQDFENQRQAIQDQAEANSLQSTLDYLKQRLDLLKSYGANTEDIERKIAAAELAISKDKIDTQIDYERKKEEAIANLKQAAFDGAVTILRNIAEAEEIERQKQIESLTAQKDFEIELAGDNAAKKEEIEANYQEQIKKIEAESRAAKRKQAVFEKALALTQAGVNVALGVTNALGSAPPPLNFILAALVGAAGAIQIAAIASKPIPQFATGTESSPEGPAIVNERGQELIIDPSGKMRMIDSKGPALTYLEKGSQVKTAPVTQKILADTMAERSVGSFKSGDKSIQEIIHYENTKMLAGVLRSRFASLEHTIKNKKELHVDFGAISHSIKKGQQWTNFVKDNYGG